MSMEEMKIGRAHVINCTQYVCVVHTQWERLIHVQRCNDSLEIFVMHKAMSSYDAETHQQRSQVFFFPLQGVHLHRWIEFFICLYSPFCFGLWEA